MSESKNFIQLDFGPYLFFYTTGIPKWLKVFQKYTFERPFSVHEERIIYYIEIFISNKSISDLKIYSVDSSLPVNIQLLLMLLLVSSLVGFCVGCFCLTRRDHDKMPKPLQACWTPPPAKLEDNENAQTNV